MGVEQGQKKINVKTKRKRTFPKQKFEREKQRLRPCFRVVRGGEREVDSGEVGQW
jgi:hypothetical protein